MSLSQSQFVYISIMFSTILCAFINDFCILASENIHSQMCLQLTPFSAFKYVRNMDCWDVHLEVV